MAGPRRELACELLVPRRVAGHARAHDGADRLGEPLAAERATTHEVEPSNVALEQREQSGRVVGGHAAGQLGVLAAELVQPQIGGCARRALAEGDAEPGGRSLDGAIDHHLLREADQIGRNRGGWCRRHGPGPAEQADHGFAQRGRQAIGLLRQHQRVRRQRHAEFADGRLEEEAAVDVLVAVERRGGDLAGALGDETVS